MKTFLRENPTIAFGLGLPLLLVFSFLLLSGIPAMTVDDPQHEVLYASSYYGYPNGIQIAVENNEVKVTYIGTVINHNQLPSIWRYNPTNGSVKEIPISLPPGLPIPDRTQAIPTQQQTTVSEIDIPDIKGLKVDSSNISPDGYEFIFGNRYSGNIFDGIFGYSNNRNQALLVKNGRQIRLPNLTGRSYIYNTHFIGWVL